MSPDDCPACRAGDVLVSCAALAAHALAAGDFAAAERWADAAFTARGTAEFVDIDEEADR